MFELQKFIKMNRGVISLAFTDNGNLVAVPRERCFYIFDTNGNLLKKVCISDLLKFVSYCCGKLGFINNHVIITDENGNIIKKFEIENYYNNGITLVKDGFVVCFVKCAFFDFNGNKKWEFNVSYVENGPSYYNDYWYIADKYRKALLVAKDGKIIKEIKYNERDYDTAVCNKYLAVITEHHLYLYDISDPENPKEIWKVGGLNLPYQVTFSPNCEYIAVIDNEIEKLKIFSIDGRLIFEKKYWQGIYSIAWKDNKIAVGTGIGLLTYSIPPPIRCSK